MQLYVWCYCLEIGDASDDHDDDCDCDDYDDHDDCDDCDDCDDDHDGDDDHDDDDDGDDDDDDDDYDAKGLMLSPSTVFFKSPPTELGHAQEPLFVLYPKKACNSIRQAHTLRWSRHLHRAAHERLPNPGKPICFQGIPNLCAITGKQLHHDLIHCRI